MTNGEFGSAIGVSASYASYIRNGKRIPSGDVLIKIILAFELDPSAAMKAYQEGRDAFRDYLNGTVFSHTDSVPDAESETVPDTPAA